MPRLSAILFACLLAATAARADIGWDFDLHLDENYQPAGKISVILDGASYLVTDQPLGGYRTIEHTNYDARQIPATAAIACRGWWGDQNEEMYVRVEPARLLVYRREFIDTNPRPPFALFKTLLLKPSLVAMPGAASLPKPARPAETPSTSPLATTIPTVTTQAIAPKLPPKPASARPTTPPPKASAATDVPSSKLFAVRQPASTPTAQPALPPPPPEAKPPAAPATVPSRITIHLDQVLPMGVRSNDWFSCLVTVVNRGDTDLSITNLFNPASGLALKVTDASGVELSRTFAEPLRNRTSPLRPKTQTAYRVSYGGPDPSTPPVVLPDTTKSVRMQIQGTIPGTGYSGSLTSNVVEVDISE